MGIVTRIERLLKANLNDAINRAEDPAKTLNYLVIEMQESLEQAREETATAMASEKRLQQQADDAGSAARQWQERARFALTRGEEELAREALRRRTAADELATQYGRAHAEQVQAVGELRVALDRLERKIQQAKVRRTELLAQLDVARAQQLIAHSVRQTVGIEAFDTFDRIAGQIDTDRRQAIAFTRLSRDEVEDAFVVAEETEKIEQELLAMKQEMGYLEAPDAPRAIEDQGEAA